jgi:hypothetical protein
MSLSLELPGLERLIEVCRRLELQVVSKPPGRLPPKAGALVEGLPLDPVLAAVYSRLGGAVFATDVAGIILDAWNDEDRQLEEENRWWSQGHQKQLALPTFIFAGEPHLAYYYATVPDLADEKGHQPVVRLDVYENPFALPVASNVDRFFEAYSRYLEELMAIPGAREEGSAQLTFPRGVPAILGRDGKLVEMISGGRFDLLMPDLEDRGWARKVVNAGRARQ